ncbi:hypothetical protein [Peterkaempfera griseoplana]|uniref:hypothetical protein n=1 Tax=Peterkaempfera griseoplana TaxID=66896 RepID=UPI0006E3FF79|nr:hypothetical protein [Peterkaempfera griseoplana]
MITAAAPATSGHLGGHILGTLGASGAALAVTVILVIGIRGRGKIRLSQHQAALLGLVAGTLYATAQQIWSAPGSVAAGLAEAVRGGVGGNVGAGAIALVLSVILYGAKLRAGWAAALGIGAASIYAAAGGIWSIASTALASGLNHVLGV